MSSIRHADVCHCERCTDKRNRIVAFGAIRRAAEVARNYDWLCEEANEFGTRADVDRAALCATVIREAIRAAIGSDKA